MTGALSGKEAPEFNLVTIPGNERDHDDEDEDDRGDNNDNNDGDNGDGFIGGLLTNGTTTGTTSGSTGGDTPTRLSFPDAC